MDFLMEIGKLLVLLALIALLVLLTRICIHFTVGHCRSNARMDGKTVIVTGANTGIGKETARGLAARGARVIMACRDLKRATEAKDDIVASTDNANVVVMKLDLGCLKSVREFVKAFLQKEKRLDVLVNNAAAGASGNQKSEDGLQLEMQINHYGPFLLTNLLLDILKKSAPSRIVMVSSVFHKMGQIQFDNLNCEKFCPVHLKHYSNAKLANVLFANELARRLEGTGVTANSLHPGMVNTEIYRNIPARQLYWMKNILKYIYSKNVEEGAQTSIFLAVSEEVDGVTGKYFVDCKEAEMSEKATDEVVAAKLWNRCAEFVHLSENEAPGEYNL